VCFSGILSKKCELDTLSTQLSVSATLQIQTIGHFKLGLIHGHQVCWHDVLVGCAISDLEFCSGLILPSLLLGISLNTEQKRVNVCGSCTCTCNCNYVHMLTCSSLTDSAHTRVNTGAQSCVDHATFVIKYLFTNTFSVLYGSSCVEKHLKQSRPPFRIR
jgi:hypothetical protein